MMDFIKLFFENKIEEISFYLNLKKSWLCWLKATACAIIIVSMSNIIFIVFNLNSEVFKLIFMLAGISIFLGINIIMAYYRISIKETIEMNAKDEKRYIQKKIREKRSKRT